MKNVIFTKININERSSNLFLFFLKRSNPSTDLNMIFYFQLISSIHRIETKVEIIEIFSLFVSSLYFSFSDDEMKTKLLLEQK